MRHFDRGTFKTRPNHNAQVSFAVVAAQRSLFDFILYRAIAKVLIQT